MRVDTAANIEVGSMPIFGGGNGGCDGGGKLGGGSSGGNGGIGGTFGGLIIHGLEQEQQAHPQPHFEDVQPQAS